MGIEQTTYNLVPAVGLPGQLQDMNAAYIVSYPAAEQIPPGVLVELATDGKSVQRVQDAGGSMAKVVGIACFTDIQEQPAGYAQYAMVPVLRRGRVFASWNGTTQSPLTAPNVNHSSTTATNRGVFTDAATSSTAGSEIAAAPSGSLLVRDTGSTTLCLVEVNLP